MYVILLDVTFRREVPRQTSKFLFIPYVSMKWWKILICLVILIIIAYCVYLYMYKSPPVNEGFDAPDSVYTDTLHTNLPDIAPTGNTSYYIFDPSAAYLQADIYAMEYAIPLTNLAGSEAAITTDILGMTTKTITLSGPNNCSNNAGAWAGVAIDPSFSHADFTYSGYNEPAEISYDTYRNISNYDARDENINNIKTYYNLRDRQFMAKYNFISRFNNNPIGFILSNIKPNTGYINCGKNMGNLFPVPSASRNCGVCNAQSYLDMTYKSSATTPNNLKNIGKGSDISSFRDYMIQNYFFNKHGGFNAYARGGAGTGRVCENPGWSSSLFNVYNNNTISNTAKVCAQIPGEKTGTEPVNAGPGIATNILSNPKWWTLKSFMRSPSTQVLALINDFVQSKGMQPRGDADYSNNGSSYQGFGDFQNNFIRSTLHVGEAPAWTSPLMYTNLQVTGTISKANVDEIRNSIYYSMFFNFTDSSTVINQIGVGSDPPSNLYMFTDCSGMDEFKSDKGVISLNAAAVTHNSSRRKIITDQILNVLPYQTRNFIRRWALIRRTTMQRWVASKCSELTEAGDTDTNTVNLKSAENLALIEKYCCSSVSNISNWGKVTGYISGSTSVGSGSTPNRIKIINQDTFPVEYARTDGIGILPINRASNTTIDNINTNTHSQYKVTLADCTNVPKINTKTYNEPESVAPKFDLMSAPLESPSVYMVRSSTIFTPVFTNRLAPDGTYYTISINIDTTNPANVAFIKQDIYVSVASLQFTDYSFEAVVESYASGTLRLKKITPNSVIINGNINTNQQTSASWTPGLPFDYYTISYTDMESFNTSMKSAKTITAEQLIPEPTIGASTNLKIPSVNPPTFANGDSVYISDSTSALNNFSGTITAVDSTSTTLYTKITVNVTRKNGSFTDATEYSVVSASNTGNRYWLTSQEKEQILNTIAQAYYELNNGLKKMQTIFDVYQLGHTIFDVRFLDYERDSAITTVIQNKMRQLITDYKTYRTYNLSSDELAQLDVSYTTDMQELNNQLDNAVKGIATNCGIKARYVVITRTDTSTLSSTPDSDTAGIQLSQVIVIDNTGNNAAYNALVTPTSTYIYTFERTSEYKYISDANSRIDSDGSIKDSLGRTTAEAGTCNGITSETLNGSTYNKAINCDVNPVSKIISVKKPTTSSGDTPDVKAIKLNRNQSLVDGAVTLKENGKYNTRVMPYFFRSASASTTENVTIDLGALTDIVKVRLIFPKAYNQATRYKIGFLDSSKHVINTSATSNVADERTLPNPAGTDILDFDCSRTDSRDPSLPTCPTELLQPYKVARFYATITGYVSGNPVASLPGLTFTGYTIGTNAALTFNPMYNAGFVLNTANGSGNTNYKPRIRYTNNRPPTTTAGIVNCADETTLKNILRDYSANTATYKFANRADVQALTNKYDTSNYSYNPTQILKAVQIDEGICGINWREIPTNIATNAKSNPIERWGKFVYVKNLDNWGANDIYNDTEQSKIYNTLAAYNSDNPNNSLTSINVINMPDILPQETTLDTAGGVCPPAICSDINVITQLVQSFNDASGSLHNTQILRVTKAVTVTPTQCQYEVYQQGATAKRGITMNLNVTNSVTPPANSLTPATFLCKYTWDGSDITGEPAAYIQSNTPVLAYVYNYVSELMRPFVDTLTNTVTGVKPVLSTLVANNTISSDYSTYLTDTYGAYGQIKDLSGCNATDRQLGRAHCSSPAILNEFIKAYNSANRGSQIISNISHYGTSSDTTCDYLVSVASVASIIHGSTYMNTTLSAGNTQLIRATMKKSPINCYFSVDTTNSSAPYSRGLQVVDLTNPMSTSNIRNMKPVVLNESESTNPRAAWKTPITLGTQTDAQRLTITTGTTTTLTLNVPPSNSYNVGTSVTVIDTANVSNNFTARIASYNNTGSLQLNNVTPTQGANFGSLTKYTIRAIPPTITRYTGPAPIETVDYVDCSSPFVSNLLSSVLSVNVPQGTTITNVNATTCLLGTQHYKFSSPENIRNSLTLPSATAAPTSVTTTNDRNTNNLTMNLPNMAVTSIRAKDLYPSVITSIIGKLITEDTYDFRVSSSDTLPFGDTFKRISFYNDNDGRLRIKLVEDAPIATSYFAFFKQPFAVPLGNSLMNLCANAARDWWNTQYAVATSTQNKSIIGDILEYSYNSLTDSITFSAKVCDYGIYGKYDIRIDSSTRYFKVIYRQTYSNPMPTDTVLPTYTTGSSTNNLIVFSMEEITTAPTGTTSLSNAYVATSADSTEGYDPTLTLSSALKTSHNFRFLRFKVVESPVSYITQAKAAEILQMNFYKGTTSGVNSQNPLQFNYSTYSLDDVKIRQYNVYNTINSLGTASLNPVSNGNVQITVPIEKPNFSINDPVIVYSTQTPTNYFTGTITSIAEISPPVGSSEAIENTIGIRVNLVTGTFSSTATRYTIAKNMCGADYTVSSDTTLISYHKCTLTNPVEYTMNTTSITIATGANTFTYNLPCGIGYSRTPNTNKCVSNGIFSAVINKTGTPNIAMPRLQLNINQYFTINLNETRTIDYFNFMTGVANMRPTKWVLEGSMCGLDGRWITMQSQTATTYTYNTEANSSTSALTTEHSLKIYSFIETNYFPLATNSTPGPEPVSNINRASGVNVLYDPSISTSTPLTGQPGSTVLANSSVPIESFKNPTLLDTPIEGRQRRKVPRLENSFMMPLEQTRPILHTRMPVQNERRIQYLRIKILHAQSLESKIIHMSNLQFITPLGPLPTKLYKITNPMGIHPNKKNGPDALMSPDGCWINLNKEPLLVKFSTLPATLIQGFKFSASNTIQKPLDSLPSEWIVEGSYDGRQWEIYHATDEPEKISDYNSPLYRFRKDI